MVAEAKAPTRDQQDDGKPKADGDGKESPKEKVGFEHMAQAVSSRWRQVDIQTLRKYEKLAEEDMERYKNEMIVYRASLKAARETPTPTADDAAEEDEAGNLKEDNTKGESGKEEPPDT